MTVLQFISSLVNSLAWPVLIGATLATFRKPLRKLLAAGSSDRIIKRLKAGPVEMEWEATLEDTAERAEQEAESTDVTPAPSAPVVALRQDLLEMAEETPNSAVMLAYQTLERELRRAIESHPEFTLPKNRRLLPSNYSRLAFELEIIPKSMQRAVDDLRRLRDSATYSYQVNIDQAVRYVETTLRVLSVLQPADDVP